MTAETQQRILAAVDEGFDAQLATTQDFVAIPRPAAPRDRART